MWRSYLSLLKMLRQLSGLCKDPGHTEILTICNECSQSLEETQLWFDNRPDTWKKSVNGRCHARLLYRTFAGVDELEKTCIKQDRHL